jgi:hypothetical protein
MAARLGLGDLFGAAPRAIGRYTGTLLAAFVVQTLVALACMGAVAFVLAQTFARLPLWDDAVDGDLVALLWCLRHGKSALLASGGIALGALFMWQFVTWFIVGGILGVLANRPEGRGDTAKCFGASGASTFLAYVLLSLCALPGYVVVAFVLVVTLSFALPHAERALTVRQLLGPLALGILPALSLMLVLWTITDYARVELTLRGESHRPGALITYLRTIGYVARRPITVVHAGLGWFVVVLISLGYAYLSHGSPMYGAEGAVTLFVIRQGVALARTATRFGVLAGQVELGKSRPLPPPRAIEAKPDAKAA